MRISKWISGKRAAAVAVMVMLAAFLWTASAKLRAAAPELVVQSDHSSLILCMAATPDGKFLVTGGADQTARLWESRTGRLIRCFHITEPFLLRSVSISNDGRRVLAACGDFELVVRIWDCDTGQLVNSFQRESGDIAILTPDGRWVAMDACDDDHFFGVGLHDVETGRIVRRFELVKLTPAQQRRYELLGDPGIDVSGLPFLVSATFFADGSRLLTGTSSGQAFLWDVANGQRTNVFGRPDPTVHVGPVAISADGRHVVAGGIRTPRGFDPDREIFTDPETLPRRDAGADIGSDTDERIAVRMWNVGTGRLERTFDLPAVHSQEIENARENEHSFLPDELRRDRPLTVMGDFNDKVFEKLSELHGAGRSDTPFRFNPTYSMQFSPDGRHLLTQEYLWNVETGECLNAESGYFLAESGVVTSFVVGDRIAAADLLGSDGMAIEYRELDGLDDEYEDYDLSKGDESDTAPPARVLTMAGRTDDKSLVTLDDSGRIWLWNVEQRPPRILNSGFVPALGITLSPDGRSVVSTHEYGQLFVAPNSTRSQSASELRRFLVGKSPAAVSANGQPLYDESFRDLLQEREALRSINGKTLCVLWDLESGRPTFHWTELLASADYDAKLSREIPAMCFTSDGSKFCTITRQRRLDGRFAQYVRLRDTRNGALEEFGPIPDWLQHQQIQLIDISERLHLLSSLSSFRSRPDRTWEIEDHGISLMRLRDGRRSKAIDLIGDREMTAQRYVVRAGPDDRSVLVVTERTPRNPRQYWDDLDKENDQRRREREQGAEGVEGQLWADFQQTPLFRQHERLFRFWYGNKQNPQRLVQWFDSLADSQQESVSQLIKQVGQWGEARRAKIDPPVENPADVRHELTPRLLDLQTGAEIARLEAHTGPVTDAVFSPDGRTIVTASQDTTARVWRKTSTSGRSQWNQPLVLTGHTETISGVDMIGDAGLIATASDDGTTRLWNSSSGQEIGQLITFEDGRWVVVAADGRFDASDPDHIPGLHWIMPDDPRQPLPIEIFMRDYYEPRLLSKMVSGDALAPIGDIQKLNRAQPSVEITNVAAWDATDDTVDVTVSVSSVVREYGGKDHKSGIRDLHLFRDGQLVGYRSLVDAGDEAKIPFANIKLPHTGVEQVAFTAYAFNTDRVKSETTRPLVHRFKLPKRQGRAYIVSVGVNQFDQHHPRVFRNLQYAVNDATALAEMLTNSLGASGQFDAVVPITLVSSSETDTKGKKALASASKQNVKAVFDLLAGRRIDEEIRASILNADLVQQACPEDMIIISFSTHGFTKSHASSENKLGGRGGEFYVVPTDVGDAQGGEVLDRCISAEQLTQWLRDVDAGEMVMILDTCQSASAKGEGFKPGPMGNRGLGQLAYNKRMRILAASQTAAQEVGGPIRHGLLSYVLLKEGLEKNAADTEPRDRRITIGEWLEFGERQVPLFAQKIRNGELRLATLKGSSPDTSLKDATLDDEATPEQNQRLVFDFQQPALFDFTKGRRDVVVKEVTAQTARQNH